jgi:tripeptidyl-peptidase-1
MKVSKAVGFKGHMKSSGAPFRSTDTSHLVSDPAHHRYGQHLSAAYVNELVKPSHDTLKLVYDWLLDHNITADTLRYSPAKDWIKVTLSIESVERLLDTNYSLFEHEDGSQIVRAPEWSLPVHLHEHVETIQPTNSFFRARPRKSTLKVSSLDEEFNQEQATPLLVGAGPTVAEACNDTAVTPLCLRKLYGQ